ncbi:hypothetical protein PUNSTDRAFT_143905 [Punctularia strigosozonata HHB-11173 SS5]|uniref:uncharacterized protein n=1 Tax=Punctularia strigosozonata (strain HHB-11173) TaxID=741275 RepID=UPI0004416D26|nr:uncharacterized protein PUNSTDRAFT_143905 [Punctularia strigosozonata HHB-11173 SS5]EIN08265.1 hypothetical protein PUNSTDRAFT_143905 [Punctularia strigosozonata HHB-11173 SS5]
MAYPPPPRTPLRRVSHGSLLALSRSGHDPDAPDGLGYLEPAISELADEAETLQTNVGQLQRLSDSLATFNESFASWLYVLNMNALTMDWPQAPIDDISYELQRIRAEKAAQLKNEARLKAAARKPSPAIPQSEDPPALEDETTMAHDTTTISVGPSNKSIPSTGAGKKVSKGKSKLTAKEKKERLILVEKIVGHLPLSFRGSDPGLRRHVEMVIDRFLDKPDRGIRLIDCVVPPDLNEARARKCLLALAASKLIQSDNSTGTVLYHWQGIPQK